MKSPVGRGRTASRSSGEEEVSHPPSFGRGRPINQVAPAAPIPEDRERPAAPSVAQVDMDQLKSCFEEWRHTPLELLNCFCCRHCQRIPKPGEPHVKVCREGHITCRDCSAKDLPESTCCLSVNIPNSASGLIKSVLNLAVFHCPNQENGCEESCSGIDEFTAHSASCNIKGIFTCWMESCGKDFKSPSDIISHQQASHNIEGVIKMSQGFSIPIEYKAFSESKEMNALVNVEDKYFHLTARMHRQYVHLWVWDLEGKQKDGGKCTNASAKIVIRNYHPQKDVDKKIFSKTVSCFHRTIPLEFIKGRIDLHENMVLRVGANEFLKCCVEATPDGNDMWKVTIVIRVEGEVADAQV